jgi:hypothetical protein
MTQEGTRVQRYGKAWLMVSILLAASLGVLADVTNGAPPPSTAARCPLTPAGFGDPAYKPNTPVRPRVGTGFVLTGTVRSGIDCSVLKGARVEFWLRGPDGQYDDVHRGTVVTDGSGKYHFESNFPGGAGLQPHIHLRVAVPGYRTLVTVYFAHSGTTAGTFDFVLEPEV